MSGDLLKKLIAGVVILADEKCIYVIQRLGGPYWEN